MNNDYKIYYRHNIRVSHLTELKILFTFTLNVFNNISTFRINVEGSSFLNRGTKYGVVHSPYCMYC